MTKKISIIDKISLAYFTLKKEFSRVYRFNYDKHLERKIHKLINKKSLHNNKWQRIYEKHHKDYLRFIAYLQYKGINTK